MPVDPARVFRSFALVYWGPEDGWLRRGVLLASREVVTYVHDVPPAFVHKGRQVTVFLADALEKVVGNDRPAITGTQTGTGMAEVHATGMGRPGRVRLFSGPSALDYAIIDLEAVQALPAGVEPLRTSAVFPSKVFAAFLTRRKGLLWQGHNLGVRRDVRGCPPPNLLVRLERTGVVKGWSGSLVLNDTGEVVGIVLSTSDDPGQTDYICVSPAGQWRIRRAGNWRAVLLGLLLLLVLVTVLIWVGITFRRVRTP